MTFNKRPKMGNPPLLAKFIAARARDPACHQNFAPERHQKESFYMASNIFLLGKYNIDGAIQTFETRVFHYLFSTWTTIHL